MTGISRYCLSFGDLSRLNFSEKWRGVRVGLGWNPAKSSEKGKKK